MILVVKGVRQHRPIVYYSIQPMNPSVKLSEIK